MIGDFAVAYDEELGRHVFMFLVDIRKDTEEGDTHKLDAEQLNAPLSSRDVEQLARAAGDIGPMSGNRRLAAALADGAERVSYRPSELRGENAARNLAEPVAERLLEECYLDPYGKMVKSQEGAWKTVGCGRPHKAAVKRLSGTLGFWPGTLFALDDEH